MGFADLKKNRKKRFDELQGKIETAEESKNNNDDPNFWKLTVDKKKERGTAVIRFLPEPAGEDMPYVKYWDHFFQGAKGYYVEKSLNTLGNADPCSEYNSELWNTGIESNKDIVRKQKRRLHYVANVYIIEDHGDPSNNGTVRQFRFGKKIWMKINGAMKPDFPSKAPVNPFDLWDGANFNLCMVKKDGYWNYDDSCFDSASTLTKNDKDLEKIYEQAEPLFPFVDPKGFKTYDELKARLFKVLGVGNNPVVPAVEQERAVVASATTAETVEGSSVADLVESGASNEVINISSDIESDLALFDDLVSND